MPDFTTIVSNTLEEVQMIAGDTQIFIYDISNTDGTPIDLQSSICEVTIFRYGDPTYIFANLSGNILGDGPVYNQFSVTFSGSGLSGAFQHQVRITDAHGILHIPAQGKLIIFPSPDSTS
jgi:hypothetical protein